MSTLHRTATTARTFALLALACTVGAAPLHASGGDEAKAPQPVATRVRAHVDAARVRALAECKQKGIELPRDFTAWIDGDALLKASVYGCRKDPLPVLLALRSLEIDLGTTVVRRDYTQLALAFALQDSYAGRIAKAGGWNDADSSAPPALPDVAPRKPLVLRVPADPRTPVDTKDKKRQLDRDDHIVNFLEDHEPVEVERPVQELPPLEYDDQGRAKPRGKAKKTVVKERRGLVAADVIASAKLQGEFNAYMRDHGHPEVSVDCGDMAVHWMSKQAIGDGALRKRIADAWELFRGAYKAKGRMPAERDAAPSAAESMAWFLRNDRVPMGEPERAGRKGERFPLTAPWPVLMMLAADDQPLREREEIWLKLRDQGEFRTYGEYIDGIAQQFDMQSARRVAPYAFDYGSIQMMWKDGGVCGTMGNIGARSWRIAGVPASTAGQPGHCALVVMRHDAASGKYRCEGEQYATGGDEVTTVHAGWNYDDAGGRKPMVWHQSVAWGVNHGFASYVDGLVLRRAFDAAHIDDRVDGGPALVREALESNPYSLAVVEAAVRDADEPRELVQIGDAVESALERAGALDEHPLYAAALRDMVHARIYALPSPESEEERVLLLEALERQGCTHAQLLARSWKEAGGDQSFVDHCKAAVDAYLASEARTKSKREAERFLARVKAWEKSAGGGTRKKAWAEALLGSFAGRETLTVGKQTMVDPSVEHLCKLAGREAPKVGG